MWISIIHLSEVLFPAVFTFQCIMQQYIMYCNLILCMYFIQVDFFFVKLRPIHTAGKCMAGRHCYQFCVRMAVTSVDDVIDEKTTGKPSKCPCLCLLLRHWIGSRLRITLPDTRCYKSTHALHRYLYQLSTRWSELIVYSAWRSGQGKQPSI